MSNKRKLLFSITIKDCRVDTFTVRGPGGGGKDTSNTGVRVTHPPSGAAAEARDTRSQTENRRLAWLRMLKTKEFKVWHQSTVNRLLSGKSVDDLVNEAMADENIKVEVRDSEGKWQELVGA